MPTRRQLIQKITLNANASSVTFSNIPQNYTDLKIIVSTRSDYSGATNGGVTDLVIRINNDSGSNYSARVLYGQTSTAGSYTSNPATSIHFGNIPSANSTASTFCNNELYISNYTSSSNKTVILKGVRENNSSFGDIRLISGLWSNTSSINRIDILADYPGGSLIANSTFYLYGITQVPIIRGGEVSVVGGFKIHTFKSTASLQVIEGGDVEYLVVAGGGGAAGGANTGRGGGGGGAGGYRNGKLKLSPSSYSITVGSGGTGASPGTGLNNQTNGSDSIFSNITSSGGGKAGDKQVNFPDFNGKSGGSGGGATGALSGNSPVGGAGNTPSTSPSQGNNGGNSAGGNPVGGGGGGGAGGVGGNSNAGTGGSSGPGASNNISGYSITYATGGLGGNATGVTTGSSGIINTGNGGNGGNGNDDNVGGGAGGSGIVIIRYPYDGN